jgi:hypothetical protein
MKEDNNIKSLIASILKLSLKLSKCNASAKDCPVAKPNSKPKAKATPKATAKATPKAKGTPKAKATARSARVKIVGGGSAEFFE